MSNPALWIIESFAIAQNEVYAGLIARRLQLARGALSRSINRPRERCENRQQIVPREDLANGRGRAK